MLITIEGSSCSGKSTLCRALQHNLKGSLIVGRSQIYEPLAHRVIDHPDITFESLILEEPSSPLDQINLQLRFAHLVSRRLRMIQHYHPVDTTDDVIILADRDISSFYAHSRARSYDSGSSERRALAELVRYVWSQNPVTPDLFVYIQTPYEVCVERSKSRGGLPRRDLSDPSYFHRLSEGYQQMIQVRGEGYSLRLDGLESQDVIMAQVHEAIKEVSRLKPLSPLALINRLADTLK